MVAFPYMAVTIAAADTNGDPVKVSAAAPLPISASVDDLDPRFVQAINVISSTYGDTVSVASKAKNLNKFGRTANADSGVKTTVANFQGAVVNETFVSTNIIDEVVSDSASDTGAVTIEGHTIDGSGNLTFVSQNATLTGLTAVTLTTPLARANRIFAASGTFGSPASDLVGNIYVYDNTDGITSGVPNTAAATKCMIVAGKNQSEKCATSVSTADYWLLTRLKLAITESGPTAVGDFSVEIRDVANGGVWRPLGVEVSLDTSALPFVDLAFDPVRIVPKNHDVRLVVTTGTANTEVSGDIEGVLAIVV